MSTTEFIPVKTTGAAGYTPVNDSYQTATPSKQSEVSCFNKSIKKNIPLYFSVGTSDNKTKIFCQFNDQLLKERGIEEIDLIDIFVSTIAKNKDGMRDIQPPEIKGKHYISSHNSMIAIISSTHLVKNIIDDIKEGLKKLNALNSTNIELLEEYIAENHETPDYKDFKQIRSIAQGKLKVTDSQSFPYENIISLADGYIFLKGTAFKIEKSTHALNNDNRKITSADLASTDRSHVYIEHNGANKLFTPKDIKKYCNIKIINLDNTKPFTQQLKKSAQKKYDLIVMNKGLCMCHQDLACGGIQPSQKGSLYGLLTNVASILDTKKPHSLAVLTGSNNDLNIESWDEEIHQFNIANQGKLVAEANRNRAGIFKGITIKIVNPDSKRI
jgi:hypothetical protein